MRGWLIPALGVVLAAAMTVPWTYWVIRAAYDREINERANLLAQRVRIQMSALWYPPPPQPLLNSLQTELFKDNTVRSVCIFDEQINAAGYIRRNEKLAIPRNVDEADRMAREETGGYRRVLLRELRPGFRSAIYLELSISELNKLALATNRTIPELGDMLSRRIWAEILARLDRSPKTVLNPLRSEIFSDSTVQAVCILDEVQNTFGVVRANESIPYPKSFQEADSMLKADPASYRQIVRWEPIPGYQSAIYIDLSRAELNKHFWKAYRPLLRNVIALTATGLILISLACVFAYRLWSRAVDQRKRAQLEQQGMQAEHGLTAAVLAHEIRNPLAALRFQLASLRHNSENAERVTAVSATIDNELQRIQQLVQDYLVHEKAHSMRVAPVALAEAVGTLQTLMDEMLRQGGTRLVVNDFAAPVVVGCDPHALRQVLINLVINAQQAMGRGGTITITIGQQDIYGTISIADTGPGIPPEMRDRLFKPFATSKKGGSGIGLALVKRFVDNFGGNVSVASEPGQGATFNLRLPLMSTIDADPKSQPAPSPLVPAAA